MATPATGTGPFEFTDANGHQISIPLSSFSFDAVGNLVVATAWQAIVNNPAASALLQYSLERGLIAPAAASSPKPVAIIKATASGTGGNDISVTIQNIVPNADPTKTTFDIQVTQTDNYSGLTLTNMESILGSGTVVGSAPGLVHVVHGSIKSNLPAAVSNAALSGGGASTKSQLVVNDAGSSQSFILEARDVGADGDITEVTINPTASDFSLIASWTKTATGVTIGTFQSAVAGALGYEISAGAPAGGIFSVPAGVSTNLSGGASGVSASATLFSSQ